MKKIILASAIGITSITVNAQKVKESEVPQPVKTSFSKQFPGAKVEKWEKENGNYEAEFDFKKIETSALFNSSGNLLETEIEIKASELPKMASEYIAKNLGGKKVKEAAKITDAKEVVTFEAEVDDADYIFDAKGNFQKKVVENDGDKD
jgi:hypothetical protein